MFVDFRIGQAAAGAAAGAEFKAPPTVEALGDQFSVCEGDNCATFGGSTLDADGRASTFTINGGDVEALLTRSVFPRTEGPLTVFVRGSLESPFQDTLLINVDFASGADVGIDLTSSTYTNPDAAAFTAVDAVGPARVLGGTTSKATLSFRGAVPGGKLNLEATVEADGRVLEFGVILAEDFEFALPDEVIPNLGQLLTDLPEIASEDQLNDEQLDLLGQFCDAVDGTPEGDAEQSRIVGAIVDPLNLRNGDLGGPDAIEIQSRQASLKASFVTLCLDRFRSGN
ncbi:MAG: hypothetical protein ABJH68_15420 [Ilumatobacter sp.]|uniref:hypothetical protein n=1 Tax=Ilumatobacter sp. TaxID=1967498 RepID=UPI003296CF41